MSTNPIVTVGIPTYDRPLGLRRTLQCITSQTYENIEIVVSDNCSPDSDVQRVVKDFAEQDSRIRHFLQKVNIGAYLNFIFVLENARGKFFMWAADDDEWEPTFIEECMRAFDDETVLVCPHMGTHYRKRETFAITVMPELSKKKSKYENLVELFANFVANLIYGIHRTDNLRSVVSSGRKSDLIGYYWLTRILLSGNIAIVDKCLYTIGIDDSEYVVKPLVPQDNRTFVYSTCLAAVLRLLAESQFTLMEKLRSYRIVLSTFCQSYRCHEKEHVRKTLTKRLQYSLISLALLCLRPIHCFRKATAIMLSCCPRAIHRGPGPCA